jgi:hypothetical protein
VKQTYRNKNLIFNTLQEALHLAADSRLKPANCSMKPAGYPYSLPTAQFRHPSTPAVSKSVSLLVNFKDDEGGPYNIAFSITGMDIRADGTD